MHEVNKMKKNLVFGLIAAAMIVAPAAAKAGDSASRQEINQTATAIGNGSSVNQQAKQTSIQEQRNSRSGDRQRSNQVINQDGVAIDGGRVEQRANDFNHQQQIQRKSRFHR
jgi:Ni/Co efflux regulator RcnB